MNRAQFTVSQESSNFAPPHGRVIVFAPHPDDEVIGAFSLLTRFRAACFMVFVTDGAPVKLGKNRATLQRRRRRESNQVAALLRIPTGHVIRLGIPDQGTTFQLPRLIMVAPNFYGSCVPTLLSFQRTKGAIRTMIQLRSRFIKLLT